MFKRRVEALLLKDQETYRSKYLDATMERDKLLDYNHRLEETITRLKEEREKIRCRLKEGDCRRADLLIENDRLRLQAQRYYKLAMEQHPSLKRIVEIMRHEEPNLKGPLYPVDEEQQQ